MSFCIMGRPEEKLRLINASSVVENGKGIITIVLEASDMLALGHALKNLTEVKADQTIKPKSPSEQDHEEVRYVAGPVGRLRHG